MIRQDCQNLKDEESTARAQYAVARIRRRQAEGGPLHNFHFVYFIQCGNGPVKIGIALAPWKRLADLQICNPYPLTLLGVTTGGRKVERELHVRFASHRLRGEWFAVDILEEVRAIATPHPKPAMPAPPARPVFDYDDWIATMRQPEPPVLFPLCEEVTG